MKHVLDIQNLDFGYIPSKPIYENFSLQLSIGEVVAIVGASGSGKSTLFELITKNLKQQKGTIQAARISSIYQDPYSSFHPSYSILNQIQDVCPDLEELDLLCQKISLDKLLLEKKPHELSGGQLQRCSILRALLMKPNLLLADEPTSALDNLIARDVMKLLMQFLDRFGILLITHDMHLARWCSDKIISLDKDY